MTAYQNVLRDGGSLTTNVDIASVDGKFEVHSWPPVAGFSLANVPLDDLLAEIKSRTEG